MRRISLLVIASSLIACAEGASDTGGSSGAQTSGAQTSDASTGTSAQPTTDQTGETPDGSSGTTSDSVPTDDDLPDYADSPCWGDAGSTTIYNGVTHATAQVAATCRAEGDRTLVYVQDELWGTSVDQAMVNAFMHRFERFTPERSYDPDQGVITNNAEIFGELQVGGKVEIFVIDSAGGGDGYLCSWCDGLEIHLDGVILSPLDGDFPVSIAAHESYHIIHRPLDADEMMWVDESLAEAAMTANGFFTDLDWLADFRNDPDQNWGPADPGIGEFNYGAALLWGSFLWEHGGPDLMAAITAESANDWAGLDAALDRVGDPKSAWELYLEMIVASYLDAPELGYGFSSFEVGEMNREGDLVGGSLETGSLQPYGIDYFRITATGDLSLTLTTTGAEPVTALGVAAGAEVTVVQVGQSTTLSVAQGDTAFVALTARGPATYELSLQ